MESIEWSDPVSVGKFIVCNALAEDRVMDDVTTSSLSVLRGDNSTCIASAREELISAGWFLVEQVFSELSILAGMNIQRIQNIIPDGSTAFEGDSIGYLHGSADLLLRGERVALNLLCRLSGIATLTGKYVEAVKGTGVEILDTRKTTIFLLVTASLVAAICVSVSGIIGFVGLLVPHMMRLLTGPDNRRLIPMSLLAGAILLLIADTITRAVLPSEIPIGVLTALIGGPFFCYIFRKQQRMRKGV